MLCGKMRNGSVARSEESIIRMMFYRFPYYGSRSFAFAPDDALVSRHSELWQGCNKKEPIGFGS